MYVPFEPDQDPSTSNGVRSLVLVLALLLAACSSASHHAGSGATNATAPSTVHPTTTTPPSIVVKPKTATRPAGPTPVWQVPKVLPTNGVIVAGEWILLPPAPTDHPRITRVQALDIARSYMNPQSGPFTEVLLARFTDTGALPNSSVTLPANPKVSVDVRALRNLLTWVIVQTYPRPEDVAFGPTADFATHDQIEISANDGRFLRGRFTP
jgi:hypothetical protein